jgi:hypothetical protein
MVERQLPNQHDPTPGAVECLDFDKDKLDLAAGNAGDVLPSAIIRGQGRTRLDICGSWPPPLNRPRNADLPHAAIVTES